MPPTRRRRESNGRRSSFDERASENALAAWEPKTRLGKMVKTNEITTMSQALQTGLPVRETEIIDILLPEVEDEVIDVKMVQRMTDSGRRVKFVITVVVGNKDGFVGLGQAKGKEVGSSIKRAIDNAKLNMIEIRRGCGSWECGCRKPHTVPFAVTGKSGSVEVTFIPAPRGIGLATGDVAKKILRLAGIKDCWARTEGQTKTIVNYAKAVYNAMKNNAQTRITTTEIQNINIASGPITIPPPTTSETPPTEPQPPTPPPQTEAP